MTQFEIMENEKYGIAYVVYQVMMWWRVHSSENEKYGIAYVVYQVMMWQRVHSSDDLKIAIWMFNNMQYFHHLIALNPVCVSWPEMGQKPSTKLFDPSVHPCIHHVNIT